MVYINVKFSNYFEVFIFFCFFFFFQAEDGIRDADVTGVQTCALPIWPVGYFSDARARSRKSSRSCPQNDSSLYTYHGAPKTCRSMAACVYLSTSLREIGRASCRERV